jgi:hypothetical protein
MLKYEKNGSEPTYYAYTVFLTQKKFLKNSSINVSLRSEHKLKSSLFSNLQKAYRCERNFLSKFVMKGMKNLRICNK